MRLEVWTFLTDWTFGIRFVKSVIRHQFEIQFLCFLFIIRNQKASDRDLEKVLGKKVKR